MSSAFVSKSRRVRFDLHLRILDLNNVPLVSGTSFIKWHLPASTAAEHRGRTNKCAIKDHRVHYGYDKKTPVRMVVGKGGMLQECKIEFEVLQEYSAGGRGERITLGHITLNLAEYADAADLHSPGSSAADGTEEGITRRYLMQDSKINSTLKIGIALRHTEGTRDYTAPPLKTAPVFGGIAGIISSSEPVNSTAHNVTPHINGGGGDNDGSQQDLLPAMPNFSSTNKEVGEMQDMYRRTLAAFWASQPGELKADDCIEDIFGGGDGWGKEGRPMSRAQSQPGSGASTPNPDGEGAYARDGHHKGDLIHRIGHPQHGHRHQHSRHGKIRPRKAAGELDEMDLRDELVSWHIGERAFA